MEHYGAVINDKTVKLLEGKHRMLFDGYQIPLACQNGLPYRNYCPRTEAKGMKLPHIIMISDADCNLTTYENIHTVEAAFYIASIDIVHHSIFDNAEIYRHRSIAKRHIYAESEYLDASEYPEFDDDFDIVVDSKYSYTMKTIYVVHAAVTRPSIRNYEKLKLFFAWAHADTIKRALLVTTQYARRGVSDNIRHHW